LRFFPGERITMPPPICRLNCFHNFKATKLKMHFIYQKLMSKFNFNFNSPQHEHAPTVF
jgi:hypothetical protein